MQQRGQNGHTLPTADMTRRVVVLLNRQQVLYVQWPCMQHWLEKAGPSLFFAPEELKKHPYP
jgi:hypothetical protein